MNYTKIYENLIARAKAEEEDRELRRSRGAYFERHHILPRSMGGTDDLTNLATLTPEEHFVAHLLLIKIHKNNRNMILAVQIMLGKGKYDKRNKTYGWVRRSLIKKIKSAPMPGETRQKISNSRTGIEFTEDHKLALSNAKKGKTWEEIFGNETAKLRRQRASLPRGPMSEERKKNIADAKKGKSYVLPAEEEQERRRKISETSTGRKRTAEHKQKISDFQKTIKTCPICRTQGSGPAMQRWHFSQCRQGFNHDNN